MWRLARTSISWERRTLLNELTAHPDLHLEAARGDIAVWLASGRDPRDLMGTLEALPWVAIWTESTSDAFIDLLTGAWSRSPDEHVRLRHVIPADQRPADQVGTYSAKRICPAFFLNGKGNNWASLVERDRRRIRDTMVDELIRFGPARVLVEGVTTAEGCLRFLEEEVPTAATQARLLFCGVPERESGALAEVLAARADLRSRVGATGLRLEELFEQVAAGLRRAEVGDAESVWVGRTLVRLSGLLRRDPPFDQSFQIVTADLVAKPRKGGEAKEALEAWLDAEAPPWRALALGSHWPRSRRIEPISDWVIGKVDRHQGGDRPVLVLNVCGEPGSGLTTVLRLIAVRLAAMGHPTLFRPEQAAAVDEAGLRQFLSLVGEPGGKVPVLILDAADQTVESSRGVRDLPRLVAREGPAVIVRGVQTWSGTDRYGPSPTKRSVWGTGCCRVHAARSERRAG